MLATFDSDDAAQAWAADEPFATDGYETAEALPWIAATRANDYLLDRGRRPTDVPDRRSAVAERASLGGMGAVMDHDAVEAYGEARRRDGALRAGARRPVGRRGRRRHAMLRVLSGRRGWRDVTDLQPYLYRALVNEARMQRRSADRRLRREVAAARLAGAATSDLVRVEVLDALRRISVRQRSVVFFTYWLELDATATAALLHVSTRTVERELTRARRALEVLLR